MKIGCLAPVISIIVALLLTSCSTTGSLFNSNQRDKNTVAPTNNDRDVLLAGIAANQTALATKLDSNVEKGLVIQNEVSDIVRDTAGNVVVIETPNGPMTFQSRSRVDVRLNTFNELADSVNGLELAVGTRSLAQTGTNQIYGAAGFDGLRLIIQSSGGATVNANAIEAPYRGRALEAEARAKVVAEYWRGRTGHAATVISTTGEAVTGIVREVLTLTSPVGQATAAARVILEKADGSRTTVDTTETAE